MKRLGYVFLKIVLCYSNGETGAEKEVYGELLTSGTVKVFNPSYPAAECGSRHYKRLKAECFVDANTSERIYWLDDITETAVKGCEKFGICGTRFHDDLERVIVHAKFDGKWKPMLSLRVNDAGESYIVSFNDGSQIMHFGEEVTIVKGRLGEYHENN